MNNNKRYIIIAALILLLFVGITILYLYFTNPREPQQTDINFQKVMNPEITGIYDEQLTIKLEVNKEDINIPKEIPLLDITPTNVEEREAKTIAKNLGLEFEPNIFEGQVNGKILLWQNNDSHLSAKLVHGEIEYGLRNLPKTEREQINKNFVEKEIEKFTSDKIPFLNNKYIVSSVDYLIFPEASGPLVSTTENKADLIRANIVPVTTEYDILTLYPGKTENYFDFLPNGQLYGFKITKMKKAQASGETFKIKNYEQLEANLHNSQLVLLTSPHDTIYEAPPFSDIESLTITKVKLGYIAIKERATTFTPVFLLEGPVEVKGVSIKYTAHLYLPAVAGN